MSKGQAQGGGGGFGQSMPPWLGMAGMYGGGGFGGYGGGYGGYGGYGGGAGGNMSPPGTQTGQMGQPPMVADFSHGAGLYQQNQAAPYYAGGVPPPQPPAPPQPGGVDPAMGVPGGTGGPTAGPGVGSPTVDNTSGLLGGTTGSGTVTAGTPGGLFNVPTGAQPMNPGQPGQPQNHQSPYAQPGWFNRGYGMPQQGGGAGGNMYPQTGMQLPPGAMQYLSGLFGGGGYG